MHEARLWVEQGFQPCIQDGQLGGRLQPPRYVMVPQARSTSEAEARMFLHHSCRPEGLLHPVVNNEAWIIDH